MNRFSITLFSLLCFIGLKAQTYSDSISVNLFLLDDCVITINMTTEINDLYKEYGAKGFKFVAYFPNFSSKPPKIDAFIEKFKLEMPIKTDYYKLKATQLGASIMPEVVIVDERSKEIIYKGRIDNSYDKIGKRRRVVTDKNLRNALMAISNDEIIKEKSTKAIGCFINFKELE